MVKISLPIFIILMQMVLKNGMINVYFKEEIEWDLEKTFYGVEQLLPINVKVPGKKAEKELAVVM